MIIQFNPPLAEAGLALEPSDPARACWDWSKNLASKNPTDESASTETRVSNIVNVDFALFEESALYPNYIEDVQAKCFPGTNSIGPLRTEELLAASRRVCSRQSAVHRAVLTLFDDAEATATDGSMPDAA